MTKQFAAIACVALLVLSGCTSVSRGLGSITANKFADARSGTNWVVAPPQLDPPAPENKTVYISFRNISDSDLNLLEELRSSARQQGWTIVNNPQTAKYRLRASLRYFGEVDPESGGMKVASGLGYIAGAAIGAGVGYGVASASNSAVGIGVGVGVGGIAGGLMSTGLNNASRPREWAYIIDFVLEEYVSSPVEFTLSTDSSSGRRDAAGVGNARFNSGGGERGGNSSSATITKKSNYYPHGARLSVWANQMNMKEEEAMPLLTQRTTRMIGQLLPM